MTTAFGIGRGDLRHHWQGLGHRALIAHVSSYLAYLAAAWIGLQLALANGVSPVWPASGVALAAVFFFGPQVAIAIFAANLTLQFIGPGAERPIWAILAFSIGASLEP